MPSGDITVGVSEQLKLLEEVVHKLIFRDLVTPPQQCTKAAEIKSHLEDLEKFFKLSKIPNGENKVAILFNTITEDMRLEICCQVEFDANQNNYEWIKRKLIELFHPKESEITPLVKLYAIKQKPHQSLREFLSEVRIEGYKLLKGMDGEERENRLVDVFSKGLRSDEIKAALNTHHFDTLDDAYRLIKKEKTTTDECFIRQMNLSSDNDTLNEVKNLKEEMTIIKKQLQSIATILQGLKSLQPRPTYADAVRKQNASQARKQVDTPEQNRNGLRQYNPQRKSVIQCWTCGMNGHIARFCDRNNNPMCRNCGRRGHSTRNCRINKSHLVRQIQDQWDASDEEYAHIDDTQYPSAPATIEEEDETNQLSRINVLTVSGHQDQKTANQDPKAATQDPKRTNKKQKSKRTKQRPSYPQYILDLEEYVQGKRTKRNIRFEETETLITTGRMEKAKNKPIIKGLCHGKPSKIFLDTGAEINVIDRSFVRQLSKHKSVRVHPASKVIRCANNSRLNVDGWVRLSITVGGQQRDCKFWVIGNLFPKLIVGIRAMRDFNITIDPGKNCMWIGNKSIPFLSQIETQSLGKQQAGNEVVPGL